MNATEKYIAKLAALPASDVHVLRSHAGHQLSEHLECFDLFTALWWPLRELTQAAPQRDVAWLVAKLYACNPCPVKQGLDLAQQFRRCPCASLEQARRRQQQMDELLVSPLEQLEPQLHSVLSMIYRNNLTLDWVRLTDILSYWEHDSTRRDMARKYLSYT